MTAPAIPTALVQEAPAQQLPALAVASYARFGSATPFTAESLVPSTPLQGRHLLVHHRKVAGLAGLLLLGGAAVYLTGKRRRA